MLSSKLHSSIGNTDRLYVDDVFSTYLYTGNGSTQTINNGIDLAGKGGMVWLKNRTTGATSNNLQDTARGRGAAMFSDTTNANIAGFGGVSSFNSNGFTLDNVGGITTNNSGQGYASWTFRKSPRFFDVVTYTGNGASSRAISHSLGQEVGMVMTKATSTTGDWNTYHRSATGDMVLNTTAAQTGSKALVNSATATTFTVSGAANTNAVTYVAYLFAHDPSADGIIQCGSFTVPAGSTSIDINLGCETQFVLFKSTAFISNWEIQDVSRNASNTSANTIRPNTSDAEDAPNTGSARIIPNAKGFTFFVNNAGYGNVTYIYLAIRRPNKPPTTGTQVFEAATFTGNGATQSVGTLPGTDLAIFAYRTAAFNPRVSFFDRLRGDGSRLRPNDTSAEIKQPLWMRFTKNATGVTVGPDSEENISAYPRIGWLFKRAPGVFDVVCYTGTGVARTVPHNLGVAPELMIVKPRSSGIANWHVFHTDITSSPASGAYLNFTSAGMSMSGEWNSTNPTASVFSVGAPAAINESSVTCVAYLFATLPGISKVGSYTGNGSSQTINCGFTTGARFILIKRTDSTGDWYVWDTARGIVSANDPHLSLNTTVAEVTTDDSVDPEASGFIVNQVAATNVNVTGATYIFLAVS